MNDIDKRARELLAAEYERIGNHNAAGDARRGLYQPELAAIIAALTPPEGYVLVPVDPTRQMQVAALEGEWSRATPAKVWGAMLAARPEVP